LFLFPDASASGFFFFRQECYNGDVDKEEKTYIHVGNSSELTGSDRRWYRFFEILPGLLSWSTLVGMVFLSWQKPLWAAVFIIIFDLYWLIKTVFLSFHLRANHKRLRLHMATDWQEKVLGLERKEIFLNPPASKEELLSLEKGGREGFSTQIYQLVILPFYKESEEVVRETLQALVASRWPKDRMFVVLGREERAGGDAPEIAARLEKDFSARFGGFLVVAHPADIAGELPGKGSNIAFAARDAVLRLIDARKIPHTDVLVSAFDIDTHVYPDYFLCLTYHFFTAEDPHHSSFQPVPVYNNNIWEAPALSRVVATSSTFWQMMQQERPERLSTFSSHSMSLRSLVEVGYWQKNIVSEDSRIFWNHLLHYNGDYRVVPLSYPVSLDANIGNSLWQTILHVYKQQRRWTWGVENVPYLLFGFVKNKTMPARLKWYYGAVQLEGFWSLATNPLLIFMLGWLPLALGGTAFNETLLSYNLPRMTRTLMTIAMSGLIGSAIISFSLLPPRPPDYSWKRNFGMVLQWLLVPFTIVIFGAIPGLEAQTRLMLGGRWRLGFWVTPKHRK